MASATLVDGSSLDKVDLMMLTLDFDSLMRRRLADSPEWDCSSVVVSIRWQLSKTTAKKKRKMECYISCAINGGDLMIK